MKTLSTLSCHSVLAFVSDVKYNDAMRRRPGRPATGHDPRLSIRMKPSALKRANGGAKAAGTTVGKWLEAAINEKVQRKKGGRNVTKRDS